MWEGAAFTMCSEGFSEKVLFQLQPCKYQERGCCSGEKNGDPDSKAGRSAVCGAAVVQRGGWGGELQRL